MTHRNKGYIRGDTVAVDGDKMVHVIALDEQAERDHHNVVKLRRAQSSTLPGGLLHGRVISSDAVNTIEVDRRLGVAGVVLKPSEDWLLRSAGVAQTRLVVEIEDTTAKGTSTCKEYICEQDDANKNWWLSTMDMDFSLFTKIHTMTKGNCPSNAHNYGQLWLKRSGETKFINTATYIMKPGAAEASAPVAVTPAHTTAPTAGDEDSDDVPLEPQQPEPVEDPEDSDDAPLFKLTQPTPVEESEDSEDCEDVQVQPVAVEEDEDSNDVALDPPVPPISVEDNEDLDNDVAPSVEAQTRRAKVSEIKVGTGDVLRYGIDPEQKAWYEATSRKRMLGGSVPVPLKRPTVEFVFYCGTLHKDAISRIPDMEWPGLEAMLPESLATVLTPLCITETLDEDEAMAQLKELLLRVLPAFAAGGSDDAALMAQAHHLSAVFLDCLPALLKNITSTLYDGIKGLPYDAADLLATLNIDGTDFWAVVNARDEAELMGLKERLVLRSTSSSVDEPEPKRQRPRRHTTSPRPGDDDTSAAQKEKEKEEARKKEMSALRIEVVKALLLKLVNQAENRLEDDAYSTAIWRTCPRPKQPAPGPRRPGLSTQSITDRPRVAAAFLLEPRLDSYTGKPGWKVFGTLLALLMDRWREGKSSCARCTQTTHAHLYLFFLGTASRGYWISWAS